MRFIGVEAGKPTVQLETLLKVLQAPPGWSFGCGRIGLQCKRATQSLAVRRAFGSQSPSGGRPILLYPQTARRCFPNRCPSGQTADRHPPFFAGLLPEAASESRSPKPYISISTATPCSRQPGW